MIHFISPIYPGTAAGKDFAKSHEISFANEETFLKGILAVSYTHLTLPTILRV